MATLRGKVANGWLCSIEVTPITPRIDGPRDAYQVAFYENAKVVHNKYYDVHGWQLGHYYMFRIARAFQHTSEIIDARWGFSLSPPFPAPEEYNQSLCLQEDIGWLEFVLWAATHRGQPLLVVKAFAQTNPSAKTVLPIFKRLSFTCSLETAQDFGKELEFECQSAKELREALDIPSRLGD